MGRQRKQSPAKPVKKPAVVPVAKPTLPEPAKPKHHMTFAKFGSDKEKQEKYLGFLEAGANLAGAAKKVGCSRFLIREYCKANPEFAKRAQGARDKGFENTSDDVEDALSRTAKAGNVTACLAWLFNRRPHKWKDMRTLTLKGIDDVLKLLPPDLAKELRAILAGTISQ